MIAIVAYNNYMKIKISHTWESERARTTTVVPVYKYSFAFNLQDERYELPLYDFMINLHVDRAHAWSGVGSEATLACAPMSWSSYRIQTIQIFRKYYYESVHTIYETANLLFYLFRWYEKQASVYKMSRVWKSSDILM